MSSSNTEHSAHGGHQLVTHIRDLLPLPRHAVFHVKLVIHQLQSVPLISGEFRIKWKFRNLQTVNSAGRPLGLGRALALKMDSHKKRCPDENGKGKEVAEGEKAVDSQQPNSPTVNSHSQAMPTSHTPPRFERAESTHSSLNSNSKQSISSKTSNSNSNSRNSSSTSKESTPPNEGIEIDYRSEARGHTPFLPLRDYKVEFEYEVNAAVQMSVDRDSLALLPSELKLTVMQHVIPGDPEAPLNPRLGHVEVNLAEYADAGSVRRNYLLRRSKVNAMLNMTITMSQISGEENYRAPPLRKEEIKAGISEFLSLSQTPLPALNRFIPTEDPWLSNSLNMFLPQEDMVGEPELAQRGLDVPGHERRTKKRWRVGGNSRPSTGKSASQSPKTNGHVPRKQQLHPTEALIEAIFNPYPSTSTTPSPFTYYVPPAPSPSKAEETSLEEAGTDSTSRGSFDSIRRTSASEHGHEGASSSSGNGSKWWRRKTSSRPVTPARSNSTRS